MYSILPQYSYAGNTSQASTNSDADNADIKIRRNNRWDFWNFALSITIIFLKPSACNTNYLKSDK